MIGPSAKLINVSQSLSRASGHLRLPGETILLGGPSTDGSCQNQTQNGYSLPFATQAIAGKADGVERPGGTARADIAEHLLAPTEASYERAPTILPRYAPLDTPQEAVSHTR